MASGRKNGQDKPALPPVLDVMAYRPPMTVGSPLPSSDSLVIDFSAGNLDGSLNGTLADGSLVSSGVNGGYGSDFAQDNASYQPTLSKGTGPNGVDVIVNASGKGLYAENSASECSFLLNTVKFDLVCVVYKDAAANEMLIGNGTSSAEKTCYSYWRSTDNLRWDSHDGAGGTLAYHETVAPYQYPEASWEVAWIRGEGVGGNVRMSVDKGATFDTGSAISGVVSGDLVRDLGMYCLNSGGSPSTAITGKYARLMVWSSNLDAAEITELSDYLTEVYGL